jgi:hypothetical protein
VTLSAAALSIAAPASAQSLLATSEDAHQVASQYVLVNRYSRTLAGNQKPAFLLEGIEGAPPPVPRSCG